MKDGVSQKISVKRVDRSGNTSDAKRDIIEQHSLLLKVDDREAFIIDCTDDCLKELCAGRAYSDGLIEAADDIISFNIDEEGRAFMTTQKKAFPPKNEKMKVGETDYKMVFAVIDEFLKDMELHRRTGSTHLCILSNGDGIIFKCEDISRHNAVDKALGYALLNGIDMRECMLFTSGRVPEDMVAKAVRAQIPILISKSLPSLQAVRSAKEHGIILICGAGRDGYEIF